MPRESSKCRTWEKERRNRLNEAFAALCKLLPCYDPAVNASKIDILQNATSYIEDLQEKIKNLLSPSSEDLPNKVKGEEFNKVKDRVKKLLCKNEQLCCLLREAKISIPTGCGVVKKFKNPLRWSNKILPEQATILEKKELEKENNASGKRLQGRKFITKNRGRQCSQTNTPKHRKAILNRSDTKKLRTGKKKKIKSITASKCVIVLSQPSMTQSCYVITNAPSNNILGNTSAVITNPGLITSPLVSSKGVKSVSSLSSLGPGALILANGTIMPVLPPQQTLLPLASQIIRPPVIFLPRGTTTAPNSGAGTMPCKTLARIKPKHCLTRTTQVNKVPIPALTSRYANNDIVLGKVEPKVVKAKVVEKKPVQEKLEKKKEAVESAEKRKCSEEVATVLKGAKKAKTDEEKCESVVEKVSELPVAVESGSDQPQEVKVVGDKAPESSKAKDINAKKPSEPLELNINHSELSNDIFASLQVPAGCQNPESTSPTAAFLLAFPLVSSLTGVKVTEVTEEDNAESQRGTPTLLQIGTMDTTKPTQSESLTPSLLNLDTLPFFSSKDISGFYSSFDTNIATTIPTPAVTIASKISVKRDEEAKKVDYQSEQQLPQPPQQLPRTPQQQPQPPQQVPQPLQQLPHPPQQRPQPPQQRPQPPPQLPQPPQPQPPQQLSQPLQQLPQPLQQLTQPPQQLPQPSLQLPQPSQQLPQPQQHHHQQPHQQQKKADMVACFESTNPFDAPNNNLNQHLNYQSKPGVNLEAKPQAACANYAPPKGFSCNNFCDTPKTDASCSYTYSIKSYPDPVYTNSNSYSYSYPSESNFNQNYYKTMPKAENKNYYPLNYDNYSDYRKSDANAHFASGNYYSNSQYSKNKFANNKGGIQSRPPINWMTTPDSRSDYMLSQFSKENDFGHNSIYPTNTFTNVQTSYFNTNPMYLNNSNEGVPTQESRKTLDLPLVPPVNSYQRNDVEEHQFSWSPTKIPQFLDPPSFTTSALPTLVGDLALGTPLSFSDSKVDNKCQKKDNRRMKTYENSQGNFLSVSQLVDHNKETAPVRTTTRRNSGNRSSAKKVPPKVVQRKEEERKPFAAAKPEGKGMKQVGYSNGDMFCDPKNNNRNIVKNTSSNYSAEALIGHQMQSSDTNQKNRQNFSSTNKSLPVPPFLHDNIIPYFPSVELPQDNTYPQQNQNYQSGSFTHSFSSTFQGNNTYTPNTFIPTTTISSTYNFMPDMGPSGHDYTDNLNLVPKDKNCHKPPNRSVKEQPTVCSSTPKKPKRKHSSETNLGFVDFPFLSMPGSINSPILPDDFHTHTGFLQPPAPQLYPCKNPFSKSNDLGGASLLPLPPVPVSRSMQHSEISPTINNAGTSLTNFNLSTIFPEINNKSALPDSFMEGRVKEHARSYSSAVQVAFNDKPTLSFSYNCTTSQTYNSQ